MYSAAQKQICEVFFGGGGIIIELKKIYVFVCHRFRWTSVAHGIPDVCFWCSR